MQNAKKFLCLIGEDADKERSTPGYRCKVGTLPTKRLCRIITTMLLLIIISLLVCGCNHWPRLRETKTKEIENSQTGLNTRDQVNQGFVLGVGDEVKITVWRQDDLNRVLRIDPSGKIFYPLVGEIDVAGLSAEELRRIITEGLSDYIDNPQVNVNITSFRNRKIYVLGEVNKPGILVIEDAMNIMDALLNSGGLTRDADKKKIILIRNHPDQIELRSIDIKSLFDTGDNSQMVALQKDDIIYVPPSFVANVDRFFEHVAKIIYPIAETERAILLGDAIWELIAGERAVERIIISP